MRGNKSRIRTTDLLQEIFTEEQTKNRIKIPTFKTVIHMPLTSTTVNMYMETKECKRMYTIFKAFHASLDVHCNYICKSKSRKSKRKQPNGDSMCLLLYKTQTKQGRSDFLLTASAPQLSVYYFILNPLSN